MDPNLVSSAALQNAKRLRWWFLLAAATAGLAFLGGGSSRASVGLPPVGWSSGPNLPGAFGARWTYSVAYFPPTDQVVVFGGAPDQFGGSWYNDTWLYSVASDSWQQGPAAPAALKPRGGAAMAYDPAIGKIVLFGGAGTDWPAYNDTWLFNGTSWTQGPAAPAAMEGRVGAGMAYHEGIGKLVLFSGSGAKADTDTWLFDGAKWTAGPAAPAGMKSRVYFGMTYDATIGKIVMAGGDEDVDLWYFDGAAWSAGPPLSSDVGAQERMHFVHDPDLGGEFLFGGMGPAGDHGDGRIFRPSDGSWTFISPGDSKPGGRFDASLVWVPTKDAVMVIGGNPDSNDGSPPLGDTWFFRDVAPQVTSLTITPSNPDMTMSLTMVAEGTTGGYGTLSNERQWYLNGVPIPGATNTTLSPQYVHGDQIVAMWRVHDSLGVYGPWVASAPVTVINRAPFIRTVSISPPSPVMTDTLSAVVDASDPDGDTVSLGYVWKVNGTAVGGNTATLAPSYFRPNDSVTATATPTDSLGLSGTAVTSPSATVAYNLVADSGKPGGKPLVRGKGYAPNEQVDVRIDSATGAVLATYTADAAGGWNGQGLTLPTPLAGGTHMLYGTGRTSGKVGQGPILVISGATISPTKFGAGDSVTFKGVGFVAGETVNVSFPNQPAVPVVAASDGNATLTLVSPPEPNTGGDITAVAPSGTVTVRFNVAARLNAPASGVPGTSAAVSVTGFGATETVNFNIDTGPVVASGVTDANGSLSATVPLSGFFGKHTLYAKGVKSGLSVSRSLPYTATLTLSPTSGPRGTVVTIKSGPGWKPNESLRFTVGTRTLASKTTDASGSVNFTYTISDQDPLGALQIKLYSSALGQTARGTFTVTGNGGLTR